MQSNLLFEYEVYYLRDCFNSSSFLENLAKKQVRGRHTVFLTYNTRNGGSGWAPGVDAMCSKQNTYKFCYNVAYGSNDCNNFEPPEPIQCTYTNRIVLTSEV